MTLVQPGAGRACGALPAVGAPVVGVDLLSPGLRQADHAVADVLAVLTGLGGDGARDGAVVATHLTRLGPFPHVTLSVQAPALGSAELAAGLRAALPGAVVSPGADGAAADGAGADGAGADGAGADGVVAAGAAAHAARTGGRAVHFPGAHLLVGTLPVGEALAGSALDGVRLLGSGPVDPALPLVTRGHVRPSYEDGRLVLVVELGRGGTVVPFEVPDPTSCCVDHA